MAVTVGRVRPCPILDLRLVLLGHNTIRGAAGPGGADRRAAGGRRPGRSAPDDRLQVRRDLGGGRRRDPAAGRDRRAAGRRSGRVVVVSALAGVTDALLALAASRCAHGDEAALDAALDGAGASATSRPRASCRARRLRCQAIRDGRRGAPAPSWRPRWAGLLPAAELDALAGRGELWSSRLVAAALEGAGIAAGLGGHPADHGDRRPVRPGDARTCRCSTTGRANASGRCWRPARIPVTQGFIGATADGVPTTLGPRRLGLHRRPARRGARRGAGRDLDRRGRPDDGRSRGSCPARARSRAASYEEAAELATFGAKVLHPATALPLVRAGIPIVVLNSTRPDRIRHHHRARRPSSSGWAIRPCAPSRWKRGITVVNVRAPADAGRLRLSPRDVRGLRAPRGGGGRAGERRGQRVAHRGGPVPARARGAGPRRSWARSGSRTSGRSSRSWASASAHTPGLAARLFKRGAAGQRRGHLAGGLGDQHDVRGARGGRARRRAAAAPEFFG